MILELSCTLTVMKQQPGMVAEGRAAVKAFVVDVDKDEMHLEEVIRLWLQCSSRPQPNLPTNKVPMMSPHQTKMGMHNISWIN